MSCSRRAPATVDYQAKVVLATFLTLLVPTIGCETPESDLAGAGRLQPETLGALSEQFASAIGDSIGKAQKAQFMGNGDRVLVLDRFAPHMRLFDKSGELLWTGGWSGDGPLELKRPRGLAAVDSQAVVVQQGRLTFWKLSGDSLRGYSRPLHSRIIAEDVEFGCDGELLVYGRDNQEFLGSFSDREGQSSRVTWLHRVSSDSRGEALVVEPQWAEPRTSDMAGSGRRGSVIARSPDDRLVVFHRVSPFGGGRLLEFDCGLRPIWFIDEIHLVTGDSLPVIEPRPKPMQWTNGVVALPDGVLAAVVRWNTPAQPGQRSTKETELFRFAGGEFQWSVLVPKQWFLLDYHEAAGLLMTTDEPIPHFVIIPPSELPDARRSHFR